MFYSSDEERNAEWRADQKFGAAVIDAIRADAVERYTDCERRAEVAAAECLREYGEVWNWRPPKTVSNPDEVTVWAMRILNPDTDSHAAGCTAEIAVYYGADSPASAIYGVRPDGTFQVFAD